MVRAQRAPRAGAAGAPYGFHPVGRWGRESGGPVGGGITVMSSTVTVKRRFKFKFKLPVTGTPAVPPAQPQAAGRLGAKDTTRGSVPQAQPLKRPASGRFRRAVDRSGERPQSSGVV